MERPKHRRLILTGIVLLAAGALLLGRHWIFNKTAPAPAPVTAVATEPVQTQPGEADLPAVETAATSAPARAPAPAAITGGFRGRVIDAATRRPVKEFEVRVIRHYVEENVHREDEPIAKMFQAETGRFAWSGLQVATWTASVSARGYQQFDITGLKIAAGKTTREILVLLLHGHTVRGRVFELGTGAGIAEATVSFKQSNAWGGAYRSTPHVKSKDDGSFVLDGVPGGEVKLAVYAQEHAYREIEITVDEKTLPQEIALSSGGTIAGIVTSAAGAPLKLQIMLDGPYVGHLNSTNEAGRFSFRNMPPGHYEIKTLDAVGSAQIEFELGQDERKEDLLLTVGTGRSVRGVVRGLQPEQLKRIHLSLGAGSGYFSARADEQGSYAFRGVPPGPARLSVYTESRQVEKKLVVPADQDVVLDIVFPPGARLSGRVTKGGNPAAGSNVWMRLADSQPGTGTLYRARTSRRRRGGQSAARGEPRATAPAHADREGAQQRMGNRPVDPAGQRRRRLYAERARRQHAENLRPRRPGNHHRGMGWPGARAEAVSFKPRAGAPRARTSSQLRTRNEAPAATQAS